MKLLPKFPCPAAALPLLGLGLLSCASQTAGGTAPASSAPLASEPAAAPAASMPPAGPPVPWRQMAKDQKGKYMKEVVMPKMQALFAAHDPEEFGTITCKTCHGEDGKERGFEMPSPSLYVLPATAAEFAALREKHPKMMKFMGEVVKPQMAALLGLPEFKPDAPQPDAFGCKACHTSKTP